jgi:hypothetical protein
MSGLFKQTSCVTRDPRCHLVSTSFSVLLGPLRVAVLRNERFHLDFPPTIQNRGISIACWQDPNHQQSCQRSVAYDLAAACRLHVGNGGRRQYPECVQHAWDNRRGTVVCSSAHLDAQPATKNQLTILQGHTSGTNPAPNP